MNEHWREFLVRQGAVTEADSLRFSTPAEEVRLAATGDVLVAAPSRTLIRARGPDTTSFLHGQLSSDVRALDASRSQLASFNSPQGRMYAVLRLFRRGEDVLMHLPAAIADDTLRRMRMYVLRSKVVLESADSELVTFGVSGPSAVTNVEKALGAAPSEPDTVVFAGTASMVRVPGPHARVDIVAPADVAEAAWQRLRPACAPVGDEASNWLDIAAAVPTVLPATMEAFVPQMANLDLLNGISFNKGCYPGQEIVARMQYLGRLKQRMYRARVACDNVPQPGTPLFSASFGDQPAGTVANVSMGLGGDYELLVVVQISVTSAAVHLARPDGPVLSFLPMPYPIPSDTQQDSRP